MKKMLLFEIRRNLLALVVFCVAAVAVSVVSVLTSDLSYHFIEPESIDLRNAGIGTFTAILCILCSVVPVMQFSYRMKMNSADLYYSLPVGRVNLMLARVLIGLFLVFVPYTLAYWLGVACVAMREPHFAFLWHLVYFVVSVPLGVGLFGVIAFLFTRGNTVLDGIAFAALWSCLLPLIVMFFVPRVYVGGDPALPEYLHYYSYAQYAPMFFDYSPLAYTAGAFHSLACRDVLSTLSCQALPIVLPLGVAEGIAAYVGLFVRADRDKAENAGQISSSWFGYRVLNPLYIALLFAAVGKVMGGDVAMCVIVAVVGAALYFLYRRSFRLRKEEVISYVLAVVVGIAALMLIHFLA